MRLQFLLLLSVMKQKVILITGASSGFGKAISERLAIQGHIVYGTSRKIQPEHNGVKMLALDVTKPETIEPAVNVIMKEQQRIDVLINNAGMGIGGAVELATPEETELQMGTNFGGVVNVSRAVLPHMRKQRNGLIINFSSIAGIFGIPYQGMYSASKFAIEGYSEALSLEVHEFGIKVVLIEPGDFSTGFTASRKISKITQDNPDYRQTFARVLKGIEHDENNGGTPEQLAKKIAKIVSKKHPKFRYVVADPLEKFAAGLSYIMPNRPFQALIRMFYKV